jgi:hypothetical protein
VLLQLVEATIRDVFAGLLVGLGAPVVVLELELESLESIRKSVQSRDTGLDNLWTNSIGGDSSNAIRLVARNNRGRHCECWIGRCLV